MIADLSMHLAIKYYMPKEKRLDALRGLEKKQTNKKYQDRSSQKENF